MNSEGSKSPSYSRTSRASHRGDATVEQETERVSTDSLSSKESVCG